MSPMTQKTVVDAKKPAVLVLTASDVKKSVPKDPANCAFAQCAKRTLHADEALIYRTRAYLRFGDTWKRYTVPPRVSRELFVFDRGGAVEPGSYQLNAVTPSNELGLGHGRGTHKPGTRNRPPLNRHVSKSVRVEMDHGLSLYERLA